MRYLSILFLLVACSKSSSPAVPPGTPVTWNLIQESWAVGSTGGNLTPGSDSAVTLSFYPDSLYTTTLSGQIVAEGTYSIIPDSIYGTFLQLNNLKTTGIFDPKQVNYITNGQVAHTLNDAYLMAQYGDTLALTTQPSPGGFTSYYFIQDPIIP